MTSTQVAMATAKVACLLRENLDMKFPDSVGLILTFWFDDDGDDVEIDIGDDDNDGDNEEECDDSDMFTSHGVSRW